MIGRFLGRFPKLIATLILGASAVSAWQATVYVHTVIWPREAAAREALIEHEIGRADSLFSRAKYETALSEYNYVLTGYPGELEAGIAGRLHDQVGMCHVALATAGNNAGSLESAFDSYRAALDLRTAGTDPAAHTQTRYHMGEAYMAMSHMTGDAQPVRAAVEAFEAGVAVLSEERNVELYATGLRSIGNAHRRLFELDRDNNPMDDALAYYQQALRVATPIEQPVVHGETLVEIGRAHVLMSQHRYRLREMQEAIKSFEKALLVLTVEDFPRLHAGAHKEIGDTYTAMSELKPKSKSDRARHQQRVIRYRNKAKQSYRIAKSFGFEPKFAIAEVDQPAPVEEEKKE